MKNFNIPKFDKCVPFRIKKINQRTVHQFQMFIFILKQSTNFKLKNNQHLFSVSVTDVNYNFMFDNRITVMDNV
jgi:hypothetical protein